MPPATARINNISTRYANIWFWILLLLLTSRFSSFICFLSSISKSGSFLQSLTKQFSTCAQAERISAVKAALRPFSLYPLTVRFSCAANLPMAGKLVNCSFIIPYISTFFYNKSLLYKKLSRATRVRVLIILHQYAHSNVLIQWPLPLFLWI